MIVRAQPRHRELIQEALNRRAAESVAYFGIPPSDLVGGRSRKKVAAYINHGRWVADCPCGGAELVTENEPMLCGSCGMTSPVDFPEGQAEIERLLLQREMRNRNWLPGESVEQIAAENIENGIWEDL